MDGQLNIYDFLYEKYKINKPIKLIELFSGYGSQAFALKYLGANFEHHKICEWAIKSIQAYNDGHIKDYTDYSSDLTDDEVIDKLFNLGVSINYNEPAKREQIKRQDYRKIYNNIIATHNLVNVQNAKGIDFEITDKENYTYLLTYSFPCQDLSLAGKGKGMSDTTTRSGMLWEVERILFELQELNQLPQVLLMENVPQVHGTDNVQDFNKWKVSLEKMGYKNYWQDLIATDYGIPQTRNRCFMVSILGNYSYTFPKKQKLELKLKDMLEDKVDEKYYLSDKQIYDIQQWNAYEKPLENIERIDKQNISPTLTTRSGAYAAGMILVKNNTKKGYLEANDGDGIDISSRMEHHRGTVQKDKIQTLTTSGGNDRGVCVGTYQFSKSDNFMQGKDRLQIGKQTSDTLQTTPKEGVVIKKDTENYIEWEEKGKLDMNCRAWKEDKVMGSLMTENNKNKILTSQPISNNINIKKELCNKLIEENNGVVINPLKGKSNKSWQFEQQVYDENGSARTLKASEGSGNIPKVLNSDLRIRKLTPKECFRLMGVKDKDFENIAKNQSNSSLYHLAGDSIVVNVLMAIFKQMLD